MSSTRDIFAITPQLLDDRNLDNDNENLDITLEQMNSYVEREKVLTPEQLTLKQNFHSTLERKLFIKVDSSKERQIPYVGVIENMRNSLKRKNSELQQQLNEKTKELEALRDKSPMQQSNQQIMYSLNHTVNIINRENKLLKELILSSNTQMEELRKQIQISNENYSTMIKKFQEKGLYFFKMINKLEKSIVVLLC